MFTAAIESSQLNFKTGSVQFVKKEKYASSFRYILVVNVNIVLQMQAIIHIVNGHKTKTVIMLWELEKIKEWVKED